MSLALCQPSEHHITAPTDPDPRASDGEFVSCLSIVESLGERLEELERGIGSRDSLIANYQAEITELHMHKDAAYAEMSRSEARARTEKERADEAERMYNELVEKDRKTQDDVAKLMRAIKSTFSKGTAA